MHDLADPKSSTLESGYKMSNCLPTKKSDKMELCGTAVFCLTKLQKENISGIVVNFSHLRKTD